jgi:glutamate--cysteine ligase catalytic subunit
VKITNAFQQLLTIWRKAKGKERDALLWGDEVCDQWCAVVGQCRTNCVQIEYLVVTFDDNNQKVRLSLCQAEVLKALAKDEELSKNGGCVPDLQHK